MALDHGFAPIIGEAPRVLVLGTMPSQQSLAKQQYYGHPQNRFWWIISELIGFDAELYQDKVTQAKARGLAIWDVCGSCHRPGSLDSAIAPDSVQANPLKQLIASYPSLQCIAFNGQAAYKLFQKHISREPLLPELVLPSTSPAYAAMKPEQKLEQWRALVAYL